MIKIYVWPDDSWIYADEYSEVLDSWRGDDYITRHVPDDFNEDEVVYDEV